MVVLLAVILPGLFPMATVDAQTPEKPQLFVTGKVSDSNHKPLVGVRVMIRGEKKGTITNNSGMYKLLIPGKRKEYIVEFKSIGMRSLTRTITGPTTLNVTMIDEVYESEEVIVTGVFNKPKESFTGAAVKISKEQLEKSSNRNILQAISNVDPSFVIVPSNDYGSNPNRLPEIRIRGFSAIPSTDDIDDLKGGQRANLVTPLFILDGFEISLQQMMDLNKDEVESITILKDASSTAMYGSRGANGIVVITSKKPQKGKLKFNYSLNVNPEIPDLSSYHLLNAAEKLELEKAVGLYEKRGDLKEDLILKQIYREKKERVLAGVNTDWLSIPVQVGLGSSHYLGVNGGDEKFRYSLGASYNAIEGAMKGAKRHTLNLNLRLLYITEKFSFNNSVSLSQTESSDGNYGAFSEYAKMNPYYEPYDKNGSIVKYFETVNNHSFAKVQNPLYRTSIGNFNTQKVDNIINNLSVTYKPTSFLNAVANFSFGKVFEKSDFFLSPKDFEYDNTSNILEKGLRDYTGREGINWSFSGTVNYYKNWGKHTVTAGVNYSLYSSTHNLWGISVKGFTGESRNSIYNGHSYKDERPRGSHSKSNTIGVAGSINYVYDNRVFFDGSYRTDGSSSFGKDSRWAPFWSVGFGWNVSNEPFMKHIRKYVPYLRFRYSYGSSGSKNFSPWESVGTYSIETGRLYTGNIVSYMTALENPNLKWQTTFQHNGGLEISLFDGWVSISANAYHKLTKDAITDTSLRLSSGWEHYKGNYGDILNQGYDIDCSVFLYQNREKDASFNLRLGTSHNKNKMVKLSQYMKDRMAQRMASDFERYNLRYVYEEGHSVDAIFAVRTYGIDPSTGKVIYRYKDDSQSFLYDINQRVPIGDRLPKIDMRISTSFNYKRLSGYAGFSLKLGGYTNNDTYKTKVENAILTENVDHRILEHRWRKPGDETIFYGLHEVNNFITDRYIQQENSLVCHNISISYDCTHKWIKKIGLEGLYLNGSIGNVFYISTIKQERGLSYPYAIEPSFGLSCTF